MDNIKKKNSVMIISILINCILLISLITKKEKTGGNSEALAKLDEILLLQKNNAIGNYLENVNRDNHEYSEDQENRAAGNLVILKQEVRKILKEELAEVIKELKDSQDVAGFTGDDEKVAEIPLSQQREAFSKSNNIVENAISTGKWTNEDVSKLREVFPQLDEKQQEKILGKLIPAINSGEITPGPNGLGFF